MGCVFLKGRRGFIKYGAISSIAVVLAAFSALYVIPAFAEHSSNSNVITPGYEKCNVLNTYTLTVTQTGGPDPIYNVRVYNRTNQNQFPDQRDFSCGAAPSGWLFKGFFTIGGESYCEYETNKDPENPDTIAEGESLNFTFSINILNESVHPFRVSTIDTQVPVGYQVYSFPNITVDCTKPTTTKSFIGPQKTADGVEWIDGVTTINLTAVDSPPHPSGVAATYYKNIIWKGETPCWDTNACNALARQYGSPGDFILYEGPFQKNEESCHVLWYYSVDNVGNIEDMKVNCFFVDKTPPNITKSVGSPKVRGDGQTFDWWVTQNTPINLNCSDVGPHPSNDVTIYWNYTVDGGAAVTGSYNGESYDLYFPEDSVHRLEFWCKDAVEKESRHDIEVFKVDTVAPTITKTMLGTAGQDYLGDCPPDDVSDVCYVADNGKGGVNVSVVDPDPTGHGCAVDMVNCTYYVWWHTDIETCRIAGGKYDGDTQRCLIDSRSFTNYKEIIFSHDSTHDLHIECRDALGNLQVDDETFLVDSTPPVTTKTYGSPHSPAGINSGAPYPHWITSTTPITLNAMDAKVGVEKIYWRNIIVDDRYCQTEGSGCQNYRVPEGTNWTEVIGNTTVIYKPEESCHLIEFYAVDRLGNPEKSKRQCVFVDNTEPVATASTGNPKIACTPEQECDYWVRDHVTNITLGCKYGVEEPHPAPLDKIQWRIKIDDNNWSAWNEASANSGAKFTFNEDSVHTLEYKCNDTVGNEDDVKTKIYRVDSTPPTIDRTIGDPKVDKNGTWYVRDHVTPITFTAVDPDPTEKGCAIDNVTCAWNITSDCMPANLSVGWVAPPFTLIFNEDCTHTVRVKCKDSLGNEAKYNESFKVDSTPPVTTKNYNQPCYPNSDGRCGHNAPEWITSASNITLSAIDPSVSGCHVGVNQIWYRVTKVDDSYCKNNSACQAATGSGDFIDTVLPEQTKTFRIPEDSCHLIEYYSTDLLGNTEQTKRQCVYVDNQGPNVNKTIGDPKTKWDGRDNATFYPNLTARCWGTGQDAIECWKVTMFTPISISCIDPEPHPVDHNTICFNVELDAVDDTAKYCDQGSMENGYCCMRRNSAPTIRFAEESQHDLKVYCKDALGNKGVVDEEKFKVEGTPFELSLHKKWNLISVPFVLLNNDISEVFSAIADKVETIWTYDGQSNKWFVFTPDGNDANDDLHTIDPGWGYWLMARNDTKIWIGGSLFNTVRTPPSRTLVPGWNLIGPYGTDWQQYGPDDTCMYDTPQNRYWDYAYCSLNSLVDTQEGYPKWSSLWTYVNCHGTAVWKGINACTDVTSKNKVVAGYGYWIEMDSQDIYAPASVCYKHTNCQYA
ncbi:MAG: hypothetical protein HZB67_03980 [Candidatus Aenigmarchaeota archaeon]|nr:hypothetical protein [Candidatus Aenigmarchaeota archaeon]